MSFNRLWGIFWEYRDVLLTGVGVTVALSIAAMLLAVVVGLVACLGTLAKSRFVRAPARSSSGSSRDLAGRFRRSSSGRSATT